MPESAGKGLFSQPISLARSAGIPGVVRLSVRNPTARNRAVRFHVPRLSIDQGFIDFPQVEYADYLLPWLNRD